MLRSLYSYWFPAPVIQETYSLDGVTPPQPIQKNRCDAPQGHSLPPSWKKDCASAFHEGRRDIFGELPSNSAYYIGEITKTNVRSKVYDGVGKQKNNS